MKFNEILIKYREFRRIKLTNAIKESILHLMSYLRRPFWESDEIQSCNKNLTDYK